MSERITIEVTGIEELDRLITNLDSALGREGAGRRVPPRGGGGVQVKALNRELALLEERRQTIQRQLSSSDNRLDVLIQELGGGEIQSQVLQREFLDSDSALKRLSMELGLNDAQNQILQRQLVFSETQLGDLGRTIGVEETRRLALENGLTLSDTQLKALNRELDSLLKAKDIPGGRLDPTGRLTNAEVKRLSQDIAVQWASQRPEILARTVFPGGGFTNKGLSTFGDFNRLNEQLNRGLFSNMMFQFKNAEIPTINRNFRMLMRLAPGGVETSQALFATRRTQRALNKGGLEGIIGIVATFLVIYGAVSSMQRQLEQQNQAYQKIFLEYKPDLTREEFQSIKDQSTDNWQKFTNYIFGVN